MLLFCLYSAVAGQGKTVGIFTQHQDIGNPKLTGASMYNDTAQRYTIKGAGYNIWFNRDEFQYLYNKIGGDFILTADFEFTGAAGDPHKKMGWMIRESTDESAASVNAVVHADGLTVLQWRPLRGAYMRDPEDEIFYAKKVVFSTIQLERTGKVITMRVASFGEPLQVVAVQEMPNLKDSVLAGLFISAHNADALAEATVWNVRFDKPVPATFNPNPVITKTLARNIAPMGCRLEVMDVFNGIRKVVRESTGRFEAPNWMPGGDKLLYNEKGSLFTIPVTGGISEKLNTGSADNINNDHGISFDGKMLAISHTVRNVPGESSAVYVLPLAGGNPLRITEQTPSYWHGWSASGKEIVHTGKRSGNNAYNLYKVNITTKAETALTNITTGHTDGPEYSPDGRYIYYNANPTGTMQLWRMKPDGSVKEQLTFDEYHNWFPHISPDGKWMVFISFPTDIEPSSHPSYKKVMLRMMPAAGGAPRVIAHLYGGQGTINVNSWSPDSRKIAFVSNSQQYP
jgi:hypothetical protein